MRLISYKGKKLINDIEYNVIIACKSRKELRKLLGLTHRELNTYWFVSVKYEECLVSKNKPRMPFRFIDGLNVFYNKINYVETPELIKEI